MDDVHDFNSSDIEFDNESSARQNARAYGQAMIDKMIADAQNDRISTKKTVKQLEQQGFAPSTTKAQLLWTRRFEAFRVHVLRQDIDSPFKGDDMIRFFDSVLDKMVTGPEKPGPNMTTIQSALKILVQYGVFKWTSQEFHIAAHDGLRFKSFLCQAFKAKRLTTGTWKKRTWVGFVTLSRMIRSYLMHYTEYGSSNFDLVIYKSLSIVFIASLGSRAGDVTKSRGYTDTECAKYEDVDMYLPADAEPDFSQLRATVTLHYTKGKKQSLNDDIVRYLRPLDDVQYAHMCPIALLLVHALRHGLVYGTTVEEVLHHTSKQPDRRVKWKFPSRPVLNSIKAHSGLHRCNLDDSTTPEQIGSTIKQMGVISGLLSRVTSHSLRLGAIRDFAHLQKSRKDTYSSIDEVRQFAGHTYTSMTKGVTERYAGETFQETYNIRADNGGTIHRREPKFAMDKQGVVASQNVTEDELQSYLNSTRPGTLVADLSANERRLTRNQIRRNREKDQRESAPAEPSFQWTASTRSSAIAPSMPGIRAKDAPRPVPEPAAPDMGKRSRTNPTLSSLEDDTVHISLIDPALLDEASLIGLEVSHAEVDALNTAIFCRVDGDEEGEGGENESEVLADDDITDTAMTEESARLILGSDDYGPDRTASNAADWINSYAKYNIVRSINFGKNWRKYQEYEKPFEDTIGPYCIRGNSRDEPTAYIYICTRTAGCTYRTARMDHLASHMNFCNDAAVASKTTHAEADILSCTHDGCNYQTQNPRKLSKHKSNTHNFTPQACDQCPEDNGKLYMTRPALRGHLATKHSKVYPSKCLFPLCGEKKDFASHTTMRDHLLKQHQLNSFEQRAPYMPEQTGTPQLVWVKQKCLLPTCRKETLFRSPYEMRVHLSSVHSLPEDEVEALMKHAVYTNKRGSAEGGNNKRKLSDTGKENLSPLEMDAVHDNDQVSDSKIKKGRKGKKN